MISVKELYDAVTGYMDCKGNIVSLDMKVDEENTPVEIIIRSTKFVDSTKEKVTETTITENGVECREVLDLY